MPTNTYPIALYAFRIGLAFCACHAAVPIALLYSGRLVSSSPIICLYPF